MSWGPFTCEWEHVISRDRPVTRNLSWVGQQQGEKGHDITAPTACHSPHLSRLLMGKPPRGQQKQWFFGGDMKGQGTG